MTTKSTNTHIVDWRKGAVASQLTTENAALMAEPIPEYKGTFNGDVLANNINAYSISCNEITMSAIDGVNAGDASAGQAQLVIGPGAVVINTTNVRADSLIFVSHADAMGSAALYTLSSDIVPGVSFIVKSNAGGGNADKFNWLIINRT
jgi:hypothetical protein